MPRGRKKKADTPAFYPRKVETNLLLEREYREDVVIRDPETGETRVQKNVLIKRYRCVGSAEKSSRIESSDVLSNAEKYNDGDGELISTEGDDD